MPAPLPITSLDNATLDAVLGTAPRAHVGVLVGAIPPVDTGNWSFRTSSLAMPMLPPSGDGKGLKAGMSAWLLARPQRSGASGVHAAILVGRASSNDVVLDHPSVSKLHARIHVDPPPARVEDCGSSNGVQMAFKRMEPGAQAPLKNGDIIGFGGVFLTYFQLPELLRLVGSIRP